MSSEERPHSRGVDHLPLDVFLLFAAFDSGIPLFRPLRTRQKCFYAYSVTALTLLTVFATSMA